MVNCLEDIFYFNLWRRDVTLVKHFSLTSLFMVNEIYTITSCSFIYNETKWKFIRITFKITSTVTKLYELAILPIQ